MRGIHSALWGSRTPSKFRLGPFMTRTERFPSCMILALLLVSFAICIKVSDDEA